MEYQEQFQIADEFSNDSQNHIKYFSTSSTGLNTKYSNKQKVLSNNSYFFNKNCASKTTLTRQKSKSRDCCSKITDKNSSQCKMSVDKDQKQCTFKPKISSNNLKNRNLNEFLQFQKGYAQKKQLNIQKIKQQKKKKQAEEFTGRPAIDAKSKKLMSKNQQPVFSRLSKQKQHSQLEEEVLFHPKICNKSKFMQRNDNVSDLLYSDARRRIEKQKLTQRESIQKVDCTPKINDNTEKLVMKKIRQQFQTHVQNIDEFSAIVGLSILSQLFNIDLNPKKDQHTQLLCQKILKYIFKDKKVQTKRMWKFSEAVMGNDYIQNELLNQIQHSQINHLFYYFYRNRMTKQRKNVQSDLPTFHPEILKNADRLAHKKRQKMIVSANQVIENNLKKITDPKQISIQELYLLNNKYKQQNLRRLKEEKDQKEMEQCTFKPQILKSQYNKNKQNLGPIYQRLQKSSDKIFKLQQKSLADPNNMLTIKTQYSCESKKTNSAKKRLSKDSANKIHEIKNIEKTVLRLSAARKDRQYNNIIKSRGYPKEIKNWENYRVNEKKSIQKTQNDLKGYGKQTKEQKGFIFDVHVGNGIIQTIFLTKQQSIYSIVDCVAKKYGFDHNKKRKLTELMNFHLNNYLKNDGA